ncbi:MAG: penicillin-binding transpeptidase domain-containing protein [Campylobacterota bacterium]|nr:penicillin-binding transpeptidase domain-containing protein [Campylobacterota bacterium]
MKNILLIITIFLGTLYSNQNLTKNIKDIAINAKQKYGAKEILISIIDDTIHKNIVTISSNENDENISKFEFEPGALFKPLTMAIALDNGYIKESEIFYANNNGIKDKNDFYPAAIKRVDGWVIEDYQKHKEKYITLKKALLTSNNTVLSDIFIRVSADDITNNIKKIGVVIDHKKEKYQNQNIYKATTSYGMGISSTHELLLKSYTLFNNNGKKDNRQVFKPSTIKYMSNILEDISLKYKVIKSNNKAIKIGIKTATTNLIEKSPNTKEAFYSNTKFISSVFGYLRVKDKKYTIGVSAIEPKVTKDYQHYSSKCAVPIFKEVVKQLSIRGNDNI